MSIAIRTVLIAAIVLLSAGAHSAREAPGPTGTWPTGADPGPAPSPADPLEAVAWLAGHWVGEGLGGWNEEMWSPPAAGSMMGVYRHIRDGRVVFYEFMTLAMRGDTLVNALKHFHPDMTGWEEPAEFVRFPLIRIEPDAAIFDGITYRRDGADRMEVTVMLGPDPDRRAPVVFTYQRVRP